MAENEKGEFYTLFTNVYILQRISVQISVPAVY